MKKHMKVFIVNNLSPFTYCQDKAMVVIAEDSKHAERAARWESSDFRKAKLEVKEISTDTEQIVLVADTGA